MSDEPTGTHHFTPSSPPGIDGEIPQSITGELRTTIASMQKIKRDVLDHLKGVGEALEKLNEGFLALGTLAEKVEKLEHRTGKLETDVNKLKDDVEILKKHCHKTISIG